MTVETLIDKFEVARRLQLHFATVERLIQSDGFPVIRLGPPSRRQTLRFRWADIERWCGERATGDRN